ncbi:hypothetical protein K402DRAFT_131874 [Aulographum hederae CBS 113979]|uniref:F-box domain-containing protein n=1 Tax=Aulographum hederae CBS 113979 TaxID=1176131 RepID=A0A6G1HFB1_9PEZI|nr:hypothetical protein K402DRAFT_131874 [Aulographum hederae CBS 113979]
MAILSDFDDFDDSFDDPPDGPFWKPGEALSGKKILRPVPKLKSHRRISNSRIDVDDVSQPDEPDSGYSRSPSPSISNPDIDQLQPVEHRSVNDVHQPDKPNCYSRGPSSSNPDINQAKPLENRGEDDASQPDKPDCDSRGPSSSKPDTNKALPLGHRSDMSFPFLKLPAELRIMIYEMALPTLASNNSVMRAVPSAHRELRACGILGVNRQIYYEAIEVLYGEGECIIELWHTMGPSEIGLLRQKVNVADLTDRTEFPGLNHVRKVLVKVEWEAWAANDAVERMCNMLSTLFKRLALSKRMKDFTIEVRTLSHCPYHAPFTWEHADRFRHSCLSTAAMFLNTTKSIYGIPTAQVIVSANYVGTRVGGDHRHPSRERQLKAVYEEALRGGAPAPEPHKIHALWAAYYEFFKCMTWDVFGKPDTRANGVDGTGPYSELSRNHRLLCHYYIIENYGSVRRCAQLVSHRWRRAHKKLEKARAPKSHPKTAAVWAELKRRDNITFAAYQKLRQLIGVPNPFPA